MEGKMGKDEKKCSCFSTRTQEIGNEYEVGKA